MWRTVLAGCLSLYFAVPVAAVEKIAKVELFVRAGGSIELEGVRYADVTKLRTKLVEIKHRRPKPDFEIVTEKGATVKDLVPAYELLLQTGELRVGFITEPRQR